MKRFVLSIVAILAATPVFADVVDPREASRIMDYAVIGCQIHPVNAAGEMSDACKTLAAIELLESVRNSAERDWLGEVEAYLAAREREGGAAPTSQVGHELYREIVTPEPEIADTPEPEAPGMCEPDDDKPFRGYVMRASYET